MGLAYCFFFYNRMLFEDQVLIYCIYAVGLVLCVQVHQTLLPFSSGFISLLFNF